MGRPYTPETLAERWGCSARHIRRMCKSGELPSFRLGGRLLRIRADDVDSFECQNGDLPDYKENSASHGRTEMSADVIDLERMTRQRRPAAPRLDTRN
ncbi:helix-turn-helix domain-containing protein [Aureimonas populi]|uniref:Helix-turn-helix domain-containing protein n=1 Tax=Aureimonas populi TaxID=1701758 RepID=A0ABW5CFB8_9HYPH